MRHNPSNLHLLFQCPITPQLLDLGFVRWARYNRRSRTEAAQVVSLPVPDYARRMIRWSGGEGCGSGLRIGMIDSGLAAGLPAFAGRKLHQRSFIEPGRVAADPAHGTAIAALLVGAPDPAHPTGAGLLPDADLYAASIFARQGGGQSEADAFAIAEALDWMV